MATQRARFVTKLSVHTQEMDGAGREAYNSVAEGLQATPKFDLELETAASHYDLEVVDAKSQEVRPRIALALKLEKCIYLTVFSTLFP